MKFAEDFQRVGVIVLLLKENKLLLGKRKNGYGSGKYGIPGGRVDPGEKLESALKRELLEETGVMTVKLRLLGPIREDQGGFVFVHFAYVCTDFEGEIQVLEPNKCEGWEWFPLDNLPKNILRGHRSAIKMYKEGITLMDLV